MIHFSPCPEPLSQLEGQFQPSRVPGKLQSPTSAVAVKLFPSFVQRFSPTVYIVFTFKLLPYIFTVETLLFSNSTTGNLKKYNVQPCRHGLTASEDCAPCCYEPFTSTFWPLAFNSTHVVTRVAMNCALNSVTL